MKKIKNMLKTEKNKVQHRVSGAFYYILIGTPFVIQGPFEK